MSYFIADHSSRFWKDIGEQKLEIGDIPLSVPQPEQGPADRIVTLCFERLAESAIYVLDAEALVEHCDWYVERIDDALSLHVAGAQQPIQVLHVHGHQPLSAPMPD